ncbi:MAG: DNA translocase FtsK 4TM domain-containing protein, partial [Planctomycetales bacterium]|nr:DNA translocase FtsK 4TM domain-containing protein [Planctomycetales bacterium]
MAHSRKRRLDLMGLALFAGAIFATLSLLSYHRDDPIEGLFFPFNRLYQPDVLVYPQAERVANICGSFGALSAELMLRVAGYGAYYAVISLFVWSVALLSQRVIVAPFIR